MKKRVFTIAFIEYPLFYKFEFKGFILHITQGFLPS